MCITRQPAIKDVVTVYERKRRTNVTIRIARVSFEQLSGTPVLLMRRLFGILNDIAKEAALR